MNEAEWLACTDPLPMLEFLQGKASDRKLRLFAVAWVARLAVDENDRAVIELAERFADGSAKEVQRQEAWEAIENEKLEAMDWRDFDLAIRLYIRQRPVVKEMNSRSNLTGLARSVGDGGAIVLIRCIFGNPFRPTHADPGWLAWNNGTVVKLAQAIYEERAFERLPVLADALEDAGCTDADLLAHCRQQGGHVRGCWAVDLLLDKT